MSLVPVFVEIHVDDELLADSPWRFLPSRALVKAIALVAENQGARLSFRFRTTFARHAQGDDILTWLESRGHEVGAHAHGKGLAETIAAIKAAGVNPQVAAPGLVQSGQAGRKMLLKQCASLGITRVTDHCANRTWAYEGLAPRAEEGVVVLSPTVRPFDWGLMDADGTRHPLDAMCIDRLKTRERQATQQGTAYFGLTIHEHDLAIPGTLQPDEDALEYLAEYLDARVVPSMTIKGPAAPQKSTESRPISDRRVRFVRAISMATATGQRVLPKRKRSSGPTVPVNGAFEIPIGERKIVAVRRGPADPLGVVVVSLSGQTGGCRQELGHFGLGLQNLSARGWAVYLYDRAGTGASAQSGPLTPGNPAHTDDYTAVLRTAQGEGPPVVALSWSAGGIPVLRAALLGDRPHAWIDVEGPADRWSLFPPAGNELSIRDPWRDASWRMMEPVRMIQRLKRPYARLQACVDHVHGEMDVHAERMIDAAQTAGLPVHRATHLKGRLHGHPGAVIAALEWAFAQAAQA